LKILIGGQGPHLLMSAARVRAAFLAAAERCAGVRRCAARCAWRESAVFEADSRGSRCKARVVAMERLRETFPRVPPRPFAVSCAAFRRVFSDAAPFLGGGSFTPARRAFDNPMAMACRAERAPCFPARISSISSRTNSPAWVETDLPRRRSAAARLIVDFLGIRRCSRAALGADLKKSALKKRADKRGLGDLPPGEGKQLPGHLAYRLCKIQPFGVREVNQESTRSCPRVVSRETKSPARLSG